MSKIGKILTLSTFTLLAFGTVGTLAQSGNEPTTGEKISLKPTPSLPIKTNEQKIEQIAFQKESKEDPTFEKGKTKITQEGIDGERTITYERTTLEGKEIDFKEIKNEITKTPVNRIVVVGTYIAPAPTPKPKPFCDLNYSGCVPIASDVDCAGGSGNGPAYARGPINVIGSDVYDLDRNGDGIACES